MSNENERDEWRPQGREVADRDWRETRRLFVYRLDQNHEDIAALNAKFERRTDEVDARLDAVERKQLRNDARAGAFGLVGSAIAAVLWWLVQTFISVGVKHP